MLRQRNFTAQQLRAHVAEIMAGDPELAAELEETRKPPVVDAEVRIPGAEPAAPEAESPGRKLAKFIGAPEGEDLSFESIVLREGRPVLRIFRDRIDLPERIEDPASKVIAKRVGDARKLLQPHIPLVGRIELSNNPSFEWVGTGWLIDDGIVVTNRHVAREFAQRDRSRFVFRTGADPSLPQAARIDFLEEIGNANSKEVELTRVIYIAADADPDIALLQVAPHPDYRGRHIPLDLTPPPARAYVCVLGYPAYDSRIPDADLMDHLYGNVYDKKRLAPGQIMGASDGILLHNCTTLGGNSGSVVLSLQTGKAVALHFSGVFLKENRAVAARELADLLRRQPWMDGGTIRNVEDALPQTAAPAPMPCVVPGSAPIEILIRIGGAGGATVTSTVPSAAPATTSVRTIEDAVETVRRQLANDPTVVAVRAGYEFRDDWITNNPAVVVLTDSREAVPPAIPDKVGDFVVESRIADPARALDRSLDADGEAPHRYVSKYKKRTEARFKLEPVTAKMKLLCHVSPEAGWLTLNPFLDGTTDELVVGMYDFTARHIVDAVGAATKPAGRELSLVLQKGESIGTGAKADDITDEETVHRLTTALKRRFKTAWASVTGPNRLFDSSYHIKVAVRDGKAFWLSSGNWQSSNQPIVAPPVSGESSELALIRDHNREWHVVLDNKKLAEVFREHLLQDLQDAEAVVELPDAGGMPDVIVPESWLRMDELELPRRVHYFEPQAFDTEMTIEPLLTPDNYAERTLSFVREATQRLWIQNQSFKPGSGNPQEKKFDDLLDAVLAKQRGGVDVRIIFRNIGDVRDVLERIQDRGFDMNAVKIQTNCHTKGIIVDDQAVQIGSHNWTTAGTTFNRDASLIIRHPDVNRYFAAIFEHDWNRLAHQRAPQRRRGDNEVRTVAHEAEAVVPLGYVRLTWSEWTGE